VSSFLLIMDDGPAPPAATHATIADAALGLPVKQVSNVDERIGKSEIEELREQLEAERKLRRSAEFALSEQGRLATSTGPLLYPTGSYIAPIGTGANQPNSPSNGVKWPDLLQGTTSLVILLGLGLYGAVRFGHQVFCDQLGVRPEDIGLTYAASVSRAAVILVVLAVCFGVVLTSITVLGNLQVPEFPTPIRFLNPLVRGLMALAGGFLPAILAMFLGSFLGATSFLAIIAMIISAFWLLSVIFTYVV
jgi:hypothetical protein